MLIAVCRPWDLENAMMVGAPIGRDFANFWIGGRLAIEGRLGLLVDFEGYNQLLFDLFHHNPRGLVFSYPPHILLLLVPFGAMAHLPAVLLWSGANVWLVARAARLLSPDRRLGWAACLSPATFLMVALGHFGGALAFLGVFILTRAGRQPVLAGCALALMSVKPQFAASLAVFLVLVGHWRIVLIAAPFTACFVGASVLVFGLEPWVDFFDWTLPFHAQLLSEFQLSAFRTAMSVYTAARMEGLSYEAARLLHYAFAILAVGGAAFCFRREGPNPRTVALGLFAVLAALPYWAIHDLAIVIPALSVALLSDPAAKVRQFRLLPFPAAAALWIAPVFAIPFGGIGIPVVQLVINAALLLMLVGECAGRRERPGEPFAFQRE